MRACFLRNFSSVSPLQLPSKMETHFWYVIPDEVKSASLLNEYMELLSPSEKSNVLRMREPHLQKSALLARALVRTTISRYQLNCGVVDPRSWKFRKNVHGKPEVEWESVDGLSPPPPLHFNLSHTSSLIACGVTTNEPIGVDVEEKQRKMKNNILAFARRFFSSSEVEYLTAISDSEIQRLEFIKLWTLKEAYVKALGRGFSALPFKNFTIHVQPAAKRGSDVADGLDSEATEITVKSFDHPENLTSSWHFALMELAGSHYAAICTERDKTGEAGVNIPMRLTAWRTIPFVEDECVSGTDTVLPIGGLIKQS